MSPEGRKMRSLPRRLNKTMLFVTVILAGLLYSHKESEFVVEQAREVSKKCEALYRERDDKNRCKSGQTVDEISSLMTIHPARLGSTTRCISYLRYQQLNMTIDEYRFACRNHSSATQEELREL